MDLHCLNLNNSDLTLRDRAHRRDEACINFLTKLRRLSPEDPLLRAEYLEIKAAVLFDEETEAELNANAKFDLCNLRFTSVTTDLLATGATGIFQIVFTLPAVLFLDNFRCKTFLITGAIGMCICHVIVAAIGGSFETSWDTHRSAGWASIAFIWLFAVNFAYSWGPVAWVLNQGIFLNIMRSRGVSIVASTNWMFNFIIGLMTRDMLDSMKYGTYIFFAAFCAGGAIFVWLVVPETKNKTLEELDVYFGGDKDGIAERDRERMNRIEESLGLAEVRAPEDLREKEGSGLGSEHDEAVKV